MIRFVFVMIVGITMTLAPAHAAGVLAEPLSFTKPVPGGKFVLVMLGSIESEAKVKDADARSQFQELRAKYAKSGLYREGTHELVWPLEGAYAPYDSLFPASDGVHLVRIEGEWWRTKDFTGGKNRLPAEVEQQQLDGPGLSFLAQGKPIRAYTVRELVMESAELPHTPEHVLWVAGGVLNEETGRFVLFTQNSEQMTFDYKNGALVNRTKAGLGNPRLTIILIASGAISVCVLGTWAWLVFGRKRTTSQTESQTH